MAAAHGVEGSSQGPLRVAMVTTWNVRCGVAEYSRHLLEHTPREAIAPVILASEEHTTLGPAGEDVFQVWRRGADDLAALVEKAEQAGADVVHFQWVELFGLEVLGRAIDRLRSQGRRVVVTMHHLPDEIDEAGHDALDAADLVYVHSAVDRQRLATARPAARNVEVFPHGYPSLLGADRLRLREQLGLDGSPVVATCGFLSRHRGLLELIDAVGLLKARFPAVQLLALSPYHPKYDSRAHHEDCLARIYELDLVEGSHLVTDWLAPEQIVRVLAAADVIVLPYQGERATGSSAAVRLAVASGRPVVTPDVPMFADVGGAVHRSRSVEAVGIAAAIEDLLVDPQLANELTARGAQTARQASWAHCASRYVADLFRLCGRAPAPTATPATEGDSGAAAAPLDEVRRAIARGLPIEAAIRARLHRIRRDGVTREELARLHHVVAERDTAIAWLHQEVAGRDATIGWLHGEVAARDATIRRLDTALGEASLRPADAPGAVAGGAR
jgi:glycosyltransferase involved in cell wall biosynthesis